MNSKVGAKKSKSTKAKQGKKEVHKGAPLKEKLSPKTVRVYDQSELSWYHAKPYRKRHFGSLIIALLIFFSLFYFFSSTNAKNSSLAKNAQSLVSDIFGTESKEELKLSLSSTYGFSVSYDSLELYASGVDSNTGQLYVGPELQTSRAYNSVRIAPSLTGDDQASNSFGSLDLKLYSNLPVTEGADLNSLQASTVAAENPAFEAQASQKTKLGTNGQESLKTEWKSKPQEGVAGALSFGFTSYTTNLNGRPFVIIQRDGVVKNKTQQELFHQVLESLKFNQTVSSVSKQDFSSAAPVDFKKLSLIDRLTLTSGVSAEVPTQPSSSEKISTLYSPAVVKIYNFYCMDILINGQPYLQDACKAQSGSGFLIGGDGVVGTNGHVAVNKPIDIVIEDAISRSKDYGDDTYINRLIDLAGVTSSDISSANQNEVIGKIIDKFYSNIPESTFTATNNIDNILVSLGEQQPDIKELTTLTKNRQAYPDQKSIKHAKLEGYDYRAFDGVDGFKASDVAVLKIEGEGYPSVSLGDASQLNQGSELSIIGYPGAANNNGLVDSSHSLATLTSGKVSSLKKASGSDNNLIETDATIGHGNSGGPAFNEDGEVVGIATYTIDGSGEGNGTFNYVRDIADFTKLASASSVQIESKSETQVQWESGIELFYQARYSKALNNFSAVQRFYPQHPKVEQFISLSKKRIASGEEVKDFPTVLVVSGILVSLVTIAGVTFIIIRHRKKNKVFQKTNIPPSPSSQSATPQSLATNTPSPESKKLVSETPKYEPEPSMAQSSTPQSTPISENLQQKPSSSSDLRPERALQQAPASSEEHSAVPDFASLQNSQHIPDKSRLRPSVKFNIPIQSNQDPSTGQPLPPGPSPAAKSASAAPSKTPPAS